MFHFIADNVYKQCSQEQIFALATLRDQLGQQFHQAEMYANTFGLTFHFNVQAIFTLDNEENTKYKALKQNYNEYFTETVEDDTITVPSSLIPQMEDYPYVDDLLMEDYESDTNDESLTTSEFEENSISSSPYEQQEYQKEIEEQTQTSSPTYDIDIEGSDVDEQQAPISTCVKTKEILQTITKLQKQCAYDYKDILDNNELQIACGQLQTGICLHKWYITWNHMKLMVAQFETKDYICFLTHAPRLIEPFVNYRTANSARFISDLLLDQEKVLLLVKNDLRINQGRKPTYFLTRQGVHSLLDIAKRKKHYIKFPAIRKYADFISNTLSKYLRIYRK
jgi:hypothetical protein